MDLVFFYTPCICQTPISLLMTVSSEASPKQVLNAMCVPFSDQYLALYTVFGLKSSLFVNLTPSSTSEFLYGF